MFEETMETTAVETTEATSGIMGTVMKIAIPTVVLLLGVGVGYTIEKYRTAKATEPKAEQQKTEDK